MDKERVTFRPVITIQEIHQATKKDSAFRYKNVIINYSHDPYKVERYLKRGWEIVESKDPNIDDRAFTPNSKEKTIRPQMRVERTKDGYEQILMRILWATDTKNKLKDKETREQLHLQEAKRRGDKIQKSGNNTITTSSEIKFTEEDLHGDKLNG